MNILKIPSLYDWQEKIKKHEGNITIKAGRQSGKTISTAKRVVYLAQKYPGTRHLIIAASERQENFLYEQVKELIGKGYVGRSTLKRTKLTNGSEIIKFPVGTTGKYLEGLASVDFLYADEAIHIFEKVWDSIFPMLVEPRKRGLGWITLLSSTQGKPKGFFYDSFSRKDFEKISIKTEECPHADKEFLKQEKERLGERRYKVIYEAEFDKEALNYFPSDLIEKAKKINYSRSRIPRSVREQLSKLFYIGVDPARYGKSKSAIAVSEVENDMIAIVHGEEIPKNNLKELRDRIKEIYNLFKARKIFIDDGGLGQGLIDFFTDDKTLKRKIRPINNSAGGKENKLLKEDLYSNVFRLLASEKLIIVNQDEVIEGLKKVEYEYIDGERWKIKGTDMSEAIVRACWGIKEKYIKPKIVRF